MALRKASAYSKRRVVPYTRVSKKKGKSYVKTVPQQKIVKFTMGDMDLYKKNKLQHHLTLIAQENVQIRHNALEACRQFVNKKLDKPLSRQYLFKVIVFPHHIQRENKMLTGAGADRMQSGMQLSYGKSSGKAAIVKKGAAIFSVAIGDEKKVPYVRKVLKQIQPKLPGKYKVVYKTESKPVLL